MSLQWKKYPVLNDGFICLVEHMGDDSSIVQAARVSYGKDKRDYTVPCPTCEGAGLTENPYEFTCRDQKCPKCKGTGKLYSEEEQKPFLDKDRRLIRRLMKDHHTSPFEMVEFKFLVRVPMDCWRQWIRHRTANVNEYSTRYSEAIDSQQTTPPDQWRLQSSNNKQGSSGYLEKWPEGWEIKEGEFGEMDLLDETDSVPDGVFFSLDITMNPNRSPGEHLTHEEIYYHRKAKELYETRLSLGIAREQARKDLPLSTYTEAYWKCDLHNIFNFLRLRRDPHAQLEIRLYANAMYEIVKQVCPIACEAFEDYVLNARTFSAMEMNILKSMVSFYKDQLDGTEKELSQPESMTDNEWSDFLNKMK